jgi:hypothetical protein
VFLGATGFDSFRAIQLDPGSAFEISDSFQIAGTHLPKLAAGTNEPFSHR